MAWTEEQKRAIDARDSSILVSAAAGSGKTAVLVERILRKIMDEDQPCDVDSFLVVTFTNAAAAQMRDKITAQLEAALEQQPENEHLMRQLLQVDRADIITIDSFCLRLVKEHFSLLDLDSAFHIGDPGMMELLKNDVLDKLFEDKYQNDDGTFAMLVDIFGNDRDDDGLKQMILRIYRVAESFPVPEEWLDRAERALKADTWEALNDTAWMKKLWNMVHCAVDEALDYVEQAKKICVMQGGPDKNYAIAEKDAMLIRRAAEAKSYEEMQEALQISWPRLAICRGDAYDKSLLEEFKKLREKYKSMIRSLSMFRYDREDILQQFADSRVYLLPLVVLVREFMEAYAEKKAGRKQMEFSDIEHLAHRLVCSGHDADGRPVPTETGRSISERYSEIFIDEHQDSNYLQEDILTCVSGMSRGEHNIFMVGDVKQSIYRFRMARPDLFIEKYNRFKEDGNEIKIELKNNFRSRAVVLEAVNYFFYQLMGEDLGGIDYNVNVALVPSREFPDAEGRNISRNTEILMADYENEDEEGDRLDKSELEAVMIAGKIRQLVDEENGLDIYDEKMGCYRRARYGDIVILGRSVKGLGDTLYNVLTQQGIPVYLDDSKGYFNAVEIKVILSLLSVVDNCRQDIPLAAVLLSPIGDMTENELALVCDYAADKLTHTSVLYDKCICYMLDHEDSISDKLGKLTGLIETLKQDKNEMSISELIWKAVTVTGYYTYAEAMPMGEKRRANIDMLLERANEFEDGYYKGLFHFLRYVEKMKLYEVDFGEAGTVGEHDNVVRILSMHKSKGLEYPVVFVSGLWKQFNEMDSREKLIIHSDYYLASVVADIPHRYQKNSFVREAFRLLMRDESMSEELRILYVAMTRAKEKLILTGCEKDPRGIMEEYRSMCDMAQNLLPYCMRRDAKSFDQLIMACMARYDVLSEKLGADGIISMHIYDYGELASAYVGQAVQRCVELETIRNMTKECGQGDVYQSLAADFDYRYPYALYTGIRSKMSISDIKKMKAYDGQGYDMDEEFAMPEHNEEEAHDSLRDMLEDQIRSEQRRRDQKGSDRTESDQYDRRKLSGAERGTLVHKFMELLPFEQLTGREMYMDYIRSFRQTLLDKHIFNLRENSAINDKKIYNMLNSSLGQRMIQAAGRGELFREQQFSIGIPVNQIYEDADGLMADADDLVIVQGIVDAFFYEDGGIVLMDYKTDRADEDTLTGRYRAQLDYYAETLARLTGHPVREKILYSFYLDREISLT